MSALLCLWQLCMKIARDPASLHVSAYREVPPFLSRAPCGLDGFVDNYCSSDLGSCLMWRGLRLWKNNFAAGLIA